MVVQNVENSFTSGSALGSCSESHSYGVPGQLHYQCLLWLVAAMGVILRMPFPFEAANTASIRMKCTYSRALQRGIRMDKVNITKALVAYMERKLLKDALCRWHSLQQANAPQRAAVQLRMQAAQEQRRHTMLSRVWALWDERCQQWLVKELQGKLSDGHYHRHLQWQTLQGWQRWLRAQQAHQRAVWLALQQWRSRRLKGCLDCWRSRACNEARQRCRSVHDPVPCS